MRKDILTLLSALVLLFAAAVDANATEYSYSFYGSRYSSNSSHYRTARLEMTAWINSDNTVSVKIEKQDGTRFGGDSGKMYLQKDSYGRSSRYNLASTSRVRYVSYVRLWSSTTIDRFNARWDSNGVMKLYGRYEKNKGGYAWVGPIKIKRQRKVPKPDLTIHSLSVDKSAAKTGESITISASVKNVGQGESSSTNLKYYRSDDSRISTSDTYLDNDYVKSLSSGETSNEMDTVYINRAGTYYLGVCVDAVGGESRTDNNCSRGRWIMITSPPIDGQCGTAHERTFPYSDRGYGSFSQCSKGSSTNTGFPAEGRTEYWRCSGENGGNRSGQCWARREVKSLSPTISLNSVSGLSSSNSIKVDIGKLRLSFALKDQDSDLHRLEVDFDRYHRNTNSKRTYYLTGNLGNQDKPVEFTYPKSYLRGCPNLEPKTKPDKLNGECWRNHVRWVATVYDRKGNSAHVELTHGTDEAIHIYDIGRYADYKREVQRLIKEKEEEKRRRKEEEERYHEEISQLEGQVQAVTGKVTDELKANDTAYINHEGIRISDVGNQKYRKREVSKLDDAYKKYRKNNIVLHVEYSAKSGHNYPAKVSVTFAKAGIAFNSTQFEVKNFPHKNYVILTLLDSAKEIIDGYSNKKIELIKKYNAIKYRYFIANPKSQTPHSCEIPDLVYSTSKMNTDSALIAASDPLASSADSAFIPNVKAVSGQFPNIFQKNWQQCTIAPKNELPFTRAIQKEFIPDVVQYGLEEKSNENERAIEKINQQYGGKTSEIRKGIYDGTKEALIEITQDYARLLNPGALIEDVGGIIKGSLNAILHPIDTTNSVVALAKQIADTVPKLPGILASWTPYENSRFYTYITTHVGHEFLPTAKIKLLKKLKNTGKLAPPWLKKAFFLVYVNVQCKKCLINPKVLRQLKADGSLNFELTNKVIDRLNTLGKLPDIKTAAGKDRVLWKKIVNKNYHKIQEHHFIPYRGGKEKIYLNNIRKKFRNNDIPDNFLENSDWNKGFVTGHTGPHPPEYHQFISDRLDEMLDDSSDLDDFKSRMEKLSTFVSVHSDKMVTKKNLDENIFSKFDFNTDIDTMIDSIE